MSCYARGVRIEQKAGSTLDHGRTVVPAMGCGEHETAASSSSFDFVTEINRAPL